MISKNFSWKGWDWKKWLSGNKEAAKLFVSALFGLWLPADPALKVVAGSALKLALDSVDYWASKVQA
jgi:hypothetical protein